jgi:hypothetical protein
MQTKRVDKRALTVRTSVRAGDNNTSVSVSQGDSSGSPTVGSGALGLPPGG